MIRCKYCGRLFKNMQAYGAHVCPGHTKEIKDRRLKQIKDQKNFEFECEGCHRKFKTYNSLKSHHGHCNDYHSEHKQSKYKISEDLYRCECGREFNNPQSLNGHLSHCKYHHECVGTEIKKRPHELNHEMAGWEKFDENQKREIHEKSRKTYKNNLKYDDNGVALTNWYGKHHSDESKRKKREAAIKYIETHCGGISAHYNKKACEYIKMLNKQNGWNLIHAESGGEYRILGYFLDGYDPSLNIVFEYDEKCHYKDIKNNILKDKDIKRQTEIINELHCDFYRYNEELKLFYKIN